MLFESLDREHQAEQERKSGARAIIAANQRIAKSLNTFLSLGRGSDDEYAARLSMVEGSIAKIVEAACAEHDADVDTVMEAVMAALTPKTACKECGCDCSDGDCSCSNCSTCKGSKESKTAADVETGDTFTHERVSLPSADASGLGSEGSPQIDKANVPQKGLGPVDVPSRQHPSVMQDVTQNRDYGDQTNQGAHTTPDPTKAPVERVDADSPMQPEHPTAPRTKTWNGTEGLADPVTSKWAVLDGQL